ncbi:hypothetical protein NAV28_03495 [Pseudomonas stutzeri]|nr:hypothetical protein [Stutzerimonas degradans]
MKINKIDVARRQLETAIELFFSGGDLVSVITLSGAAEEIFGKIANSLNKVNAIDFVVKSHQSLGLKVTRKYITDQAYLVKNALKHADREGDESIEFDEQQEAIAMLSRALTNFSKVNMAEAFPLMERVYERMQKSQGA